MVRLASISFTNFIGTSLHYNAFHRVSQYRQIKQFIEIRGGALKTMEQGHLGCFYSRNTGWPHRHELHAGVMRIIWIRRQENHLMNVCRPRLNMRNLWKYCALRARPLQNPIHWLCLNAGHCVFKARDRCSASSLHARLSSWSLYKKTFGNKMEDMVVKHYDESRRRSDCLFLTKPLQFFNASNSQPAAADQQSGKLLQ